MSIDQAPHASRPRIVRGPRVFGSPPPTPTIRATPSTDDDSSVPTLKASPAATRGRLEGLFDVQLEPWELYDPEEGSYADQIRSLRQERDEEDRRLEQHARMIAHRNQNALAEMRTRHQPLRDPFALSEHDMTSDSIAQHGLVGGSDFVDNLDEDDITSSPLMDSFFPLQRFSND